jgi:hypothetical protein
MDQEQPCLLDVCPPDAGMMQRRIIQVVKEGEETWCEFDVVRAFADEQEALEYARANGVEDVQL